MAVTEVIYFEWQAQPATRRLSLARIHPQPGCWPPALGWPMTRVHSASISSAQLVLVCLHSPQRNVPLGTESQS
jgi:hypothetical protein